MTSLSVSASYCPSCRELTVIDIGRPCAWCDTITVPPKRRGKPKGKHARVSDEQLKVLYRVYVARRVSVRQIAEQVWEKLGYASAAGCAGSLYKLLVDRGYKLRSQREVTIARNFKHGRKPRRVFVCSLADLFHEEVPDKFIVQVFHAMSPVRRHTFQVLTKRPERMASLFGHARKCEHGWLTHNGDNPTSYGGTGLVLPDPWPLPNVWLGVSIENARHTWRADVLREIPAAVRFISAEPLLGSLFADANRSMPETADFIIGARKPLDLTGIDWLIVGGESGPGARPMHPDWARELRDACLREHLGPDPSWLRIGGPAFFFKQWGEWAPAPASGGVRPLDICMSPDGDRYEAQRDYVCAHNESDGEWLRRVGKKTAGRLLDDRTWDEMPTVTT